MKKFYVVPAEIIESNFPDDLDKMELTAIFMEATGSDAIHERMGQYLSNDGSEYEQLEEELFQWLKHSGDSPLENVTGINVWEKVEGRFTVKEFCDLIGIK